MNRFELMENFTEAMFEVYCPIIGRNCMGKACVCCHITSYKTDDTYERRYVAHCTHKDIDQDIADEII